MEKTNLESRLEATKDFIKSHKTPCFLAGSTLYGINVWLGYYKVAKNLKSGDYGMAAADYTMSHAFSIPGIVLLGFSGFYAEKENLGF